MTNSTLYFQIERLLNEEQLRSIDSILKEAPYEDGRNTATDSAREVKSNLQLNMQSQHYMAIQQILLQALNGNELFRTSTLPKNIYPFLISKYQKGNAYGWHVDSPLMGNMMRTDIAMTIFLNDPSEYEGGELELQTSFGNITYKLNKGDAICYPCTQVHRVKELISGERHVAVTWIQSLVKGNDERTILNDLQSIIKNLKRSDTHKSDEHLLQQSYSNLLRKWSE